MANLSTFFVLLSLLSLSSANYFVRFINLLEGETLTMSAESGAGIGTFNSLPPISFTQASDYVVATSERLNVLVSSASSPQIFNSSQSVILFNKESTTYTTVLIVSDASKNGIYTLVPYEEILGVAPSDKSISNQFWVRFIDARATQATNRLTVYPSSSMLTSLFAHIGYLQGTNYRVQNSATFTSAYIRDDTSGDNNTPSITASTGIAYTVVIYSSSTATMTSSVYNDRAIADNTNVQTQTIADNAFESSSFGSKVEISSLFAIFSVLVAMLL